MGQSTQFQLDVFGDLLDCFEMFRASGQMPNTDVRDMWPAFAAQVNAVAQRWLEPDSGIWEMRSEPHHFVYSKVMAWAALDRGIRAAEAAALPADLARWRRDRDAVKESVLKEGYDQQLGTFVQFYGAKISDAANLLLPIVGFIEASHPWMRSTIDFISRTLVADGMVYRYRDTDDGVPGDEATFAPCTFLAGRELGPRRVSG